MRRLGKGILVPFLAAILLATPTGCRRQPEMIPIEATDEEAQALASMVHVADPKTAGQLLRGFHAIEQNAWRWTMGNFSVILRPPAGAYEKGASLFLRFSLPEPVIKRLQSVSLSASVEGVPLEPETYTKPGDHLYRRDVPPQALENDAVIVEFTLDKALAPGELDRRELGIVVSMVGFEAK